MIMDLPWYHDPYKEVHLWYLMVILWHFEIYNITEINVPCFFKWYMALLKV